MTKVLNPSYFYNEEGELHRLDGPAKIDFWGCKKWFMNGRIHREDGPAAEYPNGSTGWYCHGRLHRIDGPAIEQFYAVGHKRRPQKKDTPKQKFSFLKKFFSLFRAHEKEIIADEKEIKADEKEIFPPSSKGALWLRKEWWVNGYLHREDGPAIINDTGDYQWRFRGQFHRIDGPAIKTRLSERWYLKGKLHRIGGPAVEHLHGSKEWWKNNRLHREDGPAVEIVNGYFLAYRPDNRFNAMEVLKNSVQAERISKNLEKIETQEWWIKGKQLSEKEFHQWSLINKSKALKQKKK